MSNKNRFCLVMVFLLTGISAFSQEFVQRFSWAHDEYASAYEARIERRTNSGTYMEIDRKLTSENYVEFSLGAGFYRYRVQAYDLLDRPAGNPAWVYVEVIPALRPELLDVNPKQLYSGEEGALVVTGRNFGIGARIYLRLRGSSGDQGQIVPREFIPSGGTGGRMVFGAAQLIEGVYDVHIQNPGGLSSTLGSVSIVPKPTESEPAASDTQEPAKTSGTLSRDSDFFVSFGYAPLIPIYGALNELLEDAKIFPIGAAARIGYTPKKMGSIVLGFEGALYWNYFLAPYEGLVSYTVHGQMIGIMAHGLLQKHLPSLNGIINVRAGGGLYSLLNLHKESSLGTQTSTNILFPALDGGLSIQWFFNDTIFLDAGIEYLHVFSVDSPSPGYIRPTLGIGVLF
jgi:hypothetical protein